MVLFLERMVLKIEQILGSKNAITALRYLILRPYLSFGLSELSKASSISKSNLLRILEPLRKEKLVVEQKEGKKKIIRINSENELVKQLWKIFMIEKKSELPPDFKNIIDLFFTKVKEEAEVFILFGSVAHGLATEKSDIDLLIVGNQKLKGPLLDYLPFRFEIHNYSWNDLKERRDFVVLETLMQGIVYKGEIFPLIQELRSFPKTYLIYRLNKVKEFLIKAKKLRGEGKRYYQELANITLGEIESLLKKKKVSSKKELKTKATLNKINQLEKEIAKEGEQVWLV